VITQIIWPTSILFGLNIMNAFREMTMKSRLIAGFGVVTTMVILVSALALQSLKNANDEFTRYVNVINFRADIATQIRTAVDRRAIAARNLVLVKSTDAMQVEHAEVVEADGDVRERLSQLNASIANASDASAQERQMVAEIARIEEAYGIVARSIVNDALNGDNEKAIADIEEKCRPLLVALIRATDTYAEYTRNYAAGMLDSATVDYDRQMTMLMAICLLALTVAVVAGILITRRLSLKLGAEPAVLSGITSRVANGGLHHVYGSEVAPKGSVLASMGHMQTSLVTLITQVRAAADNVVTGAGQIAEGNSDLSSRTEHQASALQQTASTMEELTAAVKQNADNAQQARVLVDNAASISQKGSAVVGKVVDTMQDISLRSNQIADITGIIEGIAFQTNILALNAAVEAARAGEQGRGFAVVASEVRSLAQRSSGAALEIKELITTSVEKIKHGTQLASDAGQTMQEVTESIAHVTGIMGNIAAASEEQSRDIVQINQTMAQIDQVTQQNAALVEEAAAASLSLEEQGRQLIETVRSFRIDDDKETFARASQFVTTARDIPVETTLAVKALPVVGEEKPAVALARPRPVNTNTQEWETF
jgi:methyl-accepting chemotaxis protein